ncbi:MAG: bifunctional phosphoglucose/phosphomannose isomerase [Bacteroidetes bacterium]|jgi:glucose/mannose-6-phosphate isomerase|nr:bifunctional phosphoglucose/phosphomannose isomerase [Bacteroidota bacterium]
MTLQDIKRLDPKGMYAWIKEFPEQMHQAAAIGLAAKPPYKASAFNAVVLTGLGGSAIGGDLLRSYLADELKVPFIVNRGYALPSFVGPKTLVIVSSYSGNTEETIAAHKDAVKRKAKVLCISTGGETQKMAKKHRQPWVQIPGGLSPRAALAYSFFPLLVLLSKMGFVKNKSREINETLTVLRDLSARYSDPGAPDNAALALATALKDRLPVIYSSTDHLDAINVRWRGQINENAKQLAHGHVLPEMNHNELVGWKSAPALLRQTHVVFLRDVGTHPRVRIREDITKQWIAALAGGITDVPSLGRTLLARMFSLIHTGDWVSLYLAILNGVDPEPVEPINFLKGELAKVK